MDVNTSTDLANQLINLVRDAPLWLSSLILFFGAFIEYIFPPFPGDTVLVAGGFFIARGAIPFWPSAIALVSGSLAGSIAGWWMGHFAQKHPRTRHLLFRFMGEKNLERIQETYAKYGNWILILNRFLPGIRGFFMIGAGLARIPFFRVALLGALSGLLWNALLIGVGFFVSASLPSVINLFQNYTYIVLTLVLGMGLFWGVRYLLSRRNER